MLLACLAGTAVFAQSLPHPAGKGMAAPAPGQQEEELDHVVAVVGDQAILQSDVDEEMRLANLQSMALPAAQNTPTDALKRLIDRTLIENERALQPSLSKISDSEVQQGIATLKKDIPACAHRDCSSTAGWDAFLQTQGLTPDEVDAYMKDRLQVLRFIDWRFGPSIRTTPEDIKTYYQMVLLPQFAKAKATPPPLEKVAPRIRQILQQQHVTAMLDEWLKGLRRQGEVHIVDPAYASVGGDF